MYVTLNSNFLTVEDLRRALWDKNNPLCNAEMFIVNKCSYLTPLGY